MPKLGLRDILDGAPAADAANALAALADLMTERDPYTHDHGSRVSDYALATGHALGLGGSHLERLEIGGLLHDVGKLAVPLEILNAPRSLTAAEWTVMKRHPEIGERLCRRFPSLHEFLPIVRSHHERLDGSGYPDGLRVRQIDLEAHIVCVADIFDSLVTARPYKAAFSLEKSVGILEDEVVAGKLDREVVSALRSVISDFDDDSETESRLVSTTPSRLAA